MKAVFLSAGVVNRDPRRIPSYPMAAREAVVALTAAWLPHGELVFGGHPAISPLVEHAARCLDLLNRIHIYQSRYFEKLMPTAAGAFPNVHWTSAGHDLSESLTLMRQEMIDSQDLRRNFHAAVFIGHIEGMEEELEILEQGHPHAKVIPIASTGATALHMWDCRIGLAEGRFRDELLHERRYRKMFRRLLG